MSNLNSRARVLFQLFWSLLGIGLAIYGFIKNDIRVLVAGCFIAQSVSMEVAVDGVKRRLGKVGL